MVKNKFFKNLYQSISYFLVVMLFFLILLFTFIASLDYGINYGWVAIVIAGSLVVLFFLVGFYWIFQKVEINKKGIKIMICKKIIREVSWDSVEEMTYANVKQNPAFALKIEGAKNLNLDSRKKIKEAISYYGNERIKEQAKNLTKKHSEHDFNAQPLTNKEKMPCSVTANCLMAKYKLTFKTIHDIHRDSFFHLIKIPIIITAVFLPLGICFLIIGFIINKEMLIFGFAFLIYLILFSLVILICALIIKNNISKYFKKNSVDGVIEYQIDLQNDAYIIIDLTNNTKSVLKKCDIKKITILKHSILIKQINRSSSLFPKTDEIRELFQ